MKSIMSDLSRRAFVERFVKTFLGVSLLPGLGALRGAGAPPRARAKSVIFLYLRGGLSHIDTFDPKPGSRLTPRKVLTKRSTNARRDRSVMIDFMRAK